MRVLALVRHAKSDWGGPAPDHDRPLNARGRRDAPRMASRLAMTGLKPDVILASTALRARTTAEAFAAALGRPVDLEPELYGADADVLLHRAAGTGAQTVMVVAHDPGVSALAARLSAGGIARMPTCAVAVFTWDADAAGDADPTAFVLHVPGGQTGSATPSL